MATPAVSAEPIEADASFDRADGYELTILYPRETGLPMTVWVGPKGGAGHDVRVKVGLAHGDRTDVERTAVMAVRPEPRLVKAALSRADQDAVAAWIQLNAAVIVDYWDGSASTTDLVRRLRTL